DNRRPPTADGARSQSQVRESFDKAYGEVEEMLVQTSRLLPNLTKLTSVVVAPEPAEATVRSVQVVSISTTHAVVVAVLIDGSVEKHTFELPCEAGDEHVN